MNDDMIECPTCNGFGTIDDEDDPEGFIDCPECDGAGEIDA